MLFEFEVEQISNHFKLFSYIKNFLDFKRFETSLKASMIDDMCFIINKCDMLAIILIICYFEITGWVRIHVSFPSFSLWQF